MQAPSLHFGEFHLDISNARLYRAGLPVALAPKAYSVLRHMAESGGRLVSKDELLDQAWTGRVVGDTALQVCIAKIRKALDDDRRNPRYIETVPKRGYRFIADVTNHCERVRNRSTRDADFSPAHLVGRDDSMARLEQCLEGGLTGQRRVVFITGEPGIGKTALAQAFLERAAARYGCLTTSGQCIDHQGTPEAYLPVLDALGYLCRTLHGDHVTALLRHHAPMWLTQMPALLSEDERERLQRQLIGSSQERMLREIVEALEAIAADKPLVLLLEDLQWSDHATLDLLAYLARRTEPARLLVLGTYRPGDVITIEHPLKGLTDELRSHPQLEELPLELVTRENIAVYVKNCFPGIPDEHNERLAEIIYRHTDGNPLFMVNVVEHLLEREWLVKDGDAWRVRDDYAEQTIGVPESLKEMLAHQLQRGGAEQLSILETASVAGVEFTTGELSAGSNEKGVAVEEICEQLAQNGQILRPGGLDEWPDGTLIARYAFGHALYREVLYERLAPVRRVQIHQRIGTRLEKAYGEETKAHAAQLAIHFEQARQDNQAMMYNRQAAETALRRHAHREAVAYLTKSLHFLAKLPDTASRNEEELRLQILLGSALLPIKGYAAPEVETVYTRAQALCQQLDKSQLTVQAGLGLASYYLFSGKLHSALTVVKQLCDSVKHQKDPVLRKAHIGLGTVLSYLGEPTRARHHLEEGLSAYEPEKHGPLAFKYGQDFGVVGLSIAANVLWILGFPDQARKHSQGALALAQRLGHHYSEGLALLLSARMHCFRGEKRVARDLAQRAATLSAENQFAYEYAASAMMHGAETEPKKIIESLAKFGKSVDAWRAIGTKLVVPYYLSLLASVYVEVAQLSEAKRVLDEALELVEETHERWWEAEIHRLKGEVLSKQGESLDAVETCFQKALEIARSQQAKSLELRAVMSLCRLWRQQGKKHQAREMLQEIYEWFTEGFDTHDLKAAASLLRQLDDKAG